MILAVEVVSKDSKFRDFSEKAGMYAGAGVGKYWVIDPLADKVSLTEMVPDRQRRRYVLDGVTTDASTTDLPYPITIDLPALTARRDAFLGRSKPAE